MGATTGYILKHNSYTYCRTDAPCVIRRVKADFSFANLFRRLFDARNPQFQDQYRHIDDDSAAVLIQVANSQ